MKYKIQIEKIIHEEKTLELSEIIALRIKNLRKQKGHSQTKLAEILGLSRSSITNLEKGRHSLTIEMLEKLCQIYNVKSNEILPF